MAGEPVRRCSRADIDPYAAGLYLVAPERRAILPARRRPALRRRAAASAAGATSVDVVVPTVDTELLPLAEQRDRYAAAGDRARGRVARDAAQPAWTSGRWPSAAARSRPGAGDASSSTRRSTPAAVALPVIVKPRSGSGSRGIRLVGRREELDALERDGTLLVQEHLPGPEYSLDVHRARRRARRRRRPARAAEGRLGDRGDRAHAARRAARGVRAHGRRARSG